MLLLRLARRAPALLLDGRAPGVGELRPPRRDVGLEEARDERDALLLALRRQVALVLLDLVLGLRRLGILLAQDRLGDAVTSGCAVLSPLRVQVISPRQLPCSCTTTRFAGTSLSAV